MSALIRLAASSEVDFVGSCAVVAPVRALALELCCCCLCFGLGVTANLHLPQVFDLSMDQFDDNDVLLDWEMYAGARPWRLLDSERAPCLTALICTLSGRFCVIWQSAYQGG